jgi:hypothetical protein
LTATSRIDPRANFGLRRRRDLEIQSAHDPRVPPTPLDSLERNENQSHLPQQIIAIDPEHSGECRLITRRLFFLWMQNLI